MKSEKVEGVDNLFHNKNRRSRGIGISKKMAVGIVAVVIAMTLIASGAVLTYFGTVETTVDVEQSVLVNGKLWDETTTHGQFDMYGGCCVYTKDKIENRGCVEGTLNFDTTFVKPAGTSNPTVTYYIMPGWTTLLLENKDDTSWGVINDDIWAELLFNPCCPTFVYEIEVHAASETEYGLVYYADQQDRYVNWGGNPLKEIITFTTDINGDYSDTGSVNLGMYLPMDGDWNIGPCADYSQTPDFYINAKGAKLWIVPTTDYDSEKLTGWNPTTYLFETDLVFYFDCDLELPSWFGEIYPLTTLDSGNSYTIDPKENICLITEICLDWAAYPGTYETTTKVVPS